MGKVYKNSINGTALSIHIGKRKSPLHHEWHHRRGAQLTNFAHLAVVMQPCHKDKMSSFLIGNAPSTRSTVLITAGSFRSLRITDRMARCTNKSG